jgi:hypothetical protein
VLHRIIIFAAPAGVAFCALTVDEENRQAQPEIRHVGQRYLEEWSRVIRHSALRRETTVGTNREGHKASEDGSILGGAPWTRNATDVGGSEKYVFFMLKRLRVESFEVSRAEVIALSLLAAHNVLQSFSNTASLNWDSLIVEV